MTALMWLAAIVAGAVHVLIFAMESLWWTTPQVRARFRQSPEQAEATRLFAFNQGFYNLFLALGTFAGVARSPPIEQSSARPERRRGRCRLAHFGTLHARHVAGGAHRHSGSAPPRTPQ